MNSILKCISLKKIFLTLSLALFAACMTFASTITIERASSTQYTKNNDTGEDEIILSGSVLISVVSGSTKVTIESDLITYNRVTEMLFAQGNVLLKQTESGGGGEEISANSLLFNTSTLEGVFDNGRVVQVQSSAINLPSGSTLIVASEMFGRDNSGTIAFKKGELTFCDDENPHWKIKASNIWLLPGGEFAFTNAVLYVGAIPIIYLPAFYYPKDELVFNPTFGRDERKGFFVQTTTYVWGRKPLDAGSSGDDEMTKALFNFMRPSELKEQVREGIVLHNLDESYKGDTSKYLKVKADYYTNLGALIGVEGVYKPKQIITNLSGSVDIAFSNTVFADYTNGGYTKYSRTGNVYLDHSNFMGLKLPFRYGVNLSFAMNKPFALSLSLPIYSDPFFKDDFANRSEYLDWVGLLLNNNQASTTSSVSSFTWSLSSSYTVPLADSVKPYISSLQLSSISSSLQFSSKSNTALVNENSDNWKTYTPERSFFYPSQVNPIKVNAKMSGTLVDVGSASSQKQLKSPKFPVELEVPDEFLTEEELERKKQLAENTDESSEKKSSQDNKNEEEKDDENKVDKELAFLDSLLPSLSTGSSKSVQSLDGIRYRLDYSLQPAVTTQLNYQSTDLTQPEDFDWKNLQSTYYQLKAPLTVNSSFSYRNSFITMNNVLSFNPVFQAHPNLDGYTDASKNSVLTTDYNARKLDLTESNSISFKPFEHVKMFRNTALNWNSSVNVLQTKFLGDVANPEWNFVGMDLTDAECVTNHTLSGTFSVVETDNISQVLVLSTTLPPQPDSYSASLALTFPYVNVNFAGGVKKSSEDKSKWIKSPFQESASLSLLKGDLRFTQSFNYNLEDNNADSLKLAFSYKKLQLAYTMAYTYPYAFDPSTGWTAEADKQFVPTQASIAYSYSGTNRYWKNRITFSPSVSTSIVYDCLKPTSSYFSFTPSLNFKINNFLELKLSSESKNSVIYRYIQGMTGSEYQIKGETNPIVDLWNSFAFWGNGYFWDPDQTKRKSSGFKLKSLNLTLTHDLDDWDLSSSLSLKPRLKVGEGGKKSYEFSPYFTFAVSWKPMSSLKAEIADEYGTWVLNP